MTRKVILHVGWPKTATTSLQQQLREGWPNLGGRPWNRPGGEQSRFLWRALAIDGDVDGLALDGDIESSWHDRSLPVVISNEGLIGLRKWQHGGSRLAPEHIPALVAATTWPVHVVMTLRDPLALVRSTYHYAVRGGYVGSYADYLEQERVELSERGGAFAIRPVVEAWEQAFGREAVTITWMETLVSDPVRFWDDLALATDVPELSRLGQIPLDHRNSTNLGPLRWELALNRVLKSKSDRRRARYTHRLRRLYNRRLAAHLVPASSTLPHEGSAERVVVERMEADIDWLCEHRGLARPSGART